MKILVTGGNGFLGSVIVRRLMEEGHEVVSIQRSDPILIEKQEGVTYIQGDLTELESCRGAFVGVDAVFHVAAMAGIWGPWESFYQANYIATQNVVLCCKEQEIKTLVYTSTPSVVFTGASISGSDESMDYGNYWLSHYALTKRMAEEWILGDEVLKSVDVVSIRPHLIWGVGDPHLLPRVVNRGRSKRLVKIGKGDNKVDLTHVENAAEAHICAFKKLLEDPKEISGHSFFISDDNPVFLWDWINQLFDKMGIPSVERKLPLPVVFRLAHVLELFHRWFKLKSEPPMTRFVALELAKDHYFDITKAKRLLGYKPIVDQEAALDEVVEYLKPL
jgi:nucleoside-diphosphate-sugar epimerase